MEIEQHPSSRKRIKKKSTNSELIEQIQQITNKGNNQINLMESDLIKDIIFVFQGIDGHNISYSTIEKMYVVKTPIAPPVRNILT